MGHRRLHHRTIRLQLPQLTHRSRLDKQTDNIRVLVRHQEVADMLMGPREAGRLGGGSLGEGEEEVFHYHAHNHSPSHRCISNNEGGVMARPPCKGEEVPIHARGGEVKYQRPPLDLVLVYLRNTDRVFAT
jgi:hypothetical protein